ncbi:MAG: fumarylacetoacetate hydrolase family protein [Alphaproteobacteria bacterium]
MADLAARLVAARRGGDTVTLAPGELPDDMAAAQAVQDRVWTLLDERCGGWKIGGTSQESQQRLGTSEPGAAKIPAGGFFPNYANMPVHPAHSPAIECEFALRLGRDLPPRATDYSDAEVAAAVSALAPAIEVAGTRFQGAIGEVLSRATLTADSGFGMHIVTGTFRDNWRDFDLAGHTMRLSVNGTERGAGTGARVMGNPFRALVWLANRQRTRDGLKAGEIVSTGSCTKIYPVQPGDTAHADFGTLGVVAVTFVGA